MTKMMITRYDINSYYSAKKQINDTINTPDFYSEKDGAELYCDIINLALTVYEETSKNKFLVFAKITCDEFKSIIVSKDIFKHLTLTPCFDYVSEFESRIEAHIDSLSKTQTSQAKSSLFPIKRSDETRMVDEVTSEVQFPGYKFKP